MYGWIGKWTHKKQNGLNDWGTYTWTNDWTKYQEILLYDMQKSVWKIDYIRAVLSEFVKGRIGCIFRQIIEYKTP